MEKTITFEVNDIPLSLNKLFTMHWIDRKYAQEYWDNLICSRWIDLGRPLYIQPFKLHYLIKFNINRSRDYDNYLGGTKFITDALKRTFFFRDDARWLKGISVEFSTGNNTTVISIIPQKE